jgi:hypothetical protein
MDRPQPEPGISQEVLGGVARDALDALAHELRSRLQRIPVLDSDHVNDLVDVRQNQAVALLALSQRLFCPLPLSDVVEQSNELSLPRTVGGDREPDSKGLHVNLEPLRDSRQSHPAIHLEQLRTRLPYPGNDFGDSSTGHVLESRQDFEVRVDVQVDEVPRFAVLEEHLAVGVPVKHGLEERPIVLLATLDPLLGLPAGPALLRLLELPLNRGSEPRLPGALALRAVRHGADQAPRQFGPARVLARKRSGLQMKQILQTV